MNHPLVNAYDSQTEQYHRAFQVFLDHTDQKVKAREWLDQLVGKLPEKKTFVDAGAGNGKVTAWYLDDFEKTIALEPNDSLRADLKKTCPQATILSEKILDANVPEQGDFVLCSHVFYYLDPKEWMPTLERLSSWLARRGALVVILQHHESDCMKMLRHFFGKSYDLSALAKSFSKAAGDRFDVSMEAVPARVETKDFESAATIAEFMLNLVPITEPPARKDFEDYVRRHFSRNGDGFRFSVDQAFLQIRPKN